MSSNNQVVIIEKKEKFYIYENLCVDNPFHPTKKDLLKIKDDLKEAIKFAQEYCKEYPFVEYGYTIQLKKKSKTKKK